MHTDASSVSIPWYRSDPLCDNSTDKEKTKHDEDKNMARLQKICGLIGGTCDVDAVMWSIRGPMVCGTNVDDEEWCGWRKS
jgi:hypothetical protein